jgi:hypothetical protein
VLLEWSEGVETYDLRTNYRWGDVDVLSMKAPRCRVPSVGMMKFAVSWLSGRGNGVMLYVQGTSSKCLL